MHGPLNVTFIVSKLVIAKLDKEKNKCIRKKKTGVQNIVKKIKHYQEK